MDVGGTEGSPSKTEETNCLKGCDLKSYIGIRAPNGRQIGKEGGLKELTVQEGLQSQFGSRIGIFSQHLALLHQGRDINKISKEVTDGDATENRPIS